MRFIRLGSFSLDVDVFAYLGARDWNHFLEIQEQLLFAVTDLVSRVGAEMAFPSQTMYMANAGEPPAAAAQCRAGALTRWRQPGPAEWRHPEHARSEAHTGRPVVRPADVTAGAVAGPAPRPPLRKPILATLQVKGQATASTTIRIDAPALLVGRRSRAGRKGLEVRRVSRVPGGAAERPEGRNRRHRQEDRGRSGGRVPSRRPEDARSC